MRDQSLPFMFETWSPRGIAPDHTYVLPINPEEYKVVYPTRANVTQTKGGGWEDNAGLGLPRIIIQGTFGYLGSLPKGGGKHYRHEELSGWQLFKEFEAKIFFDFYDRFGTTEENSSVSYNDLRFYDFCDENFFSVQINRFDVKRNIQRRFLYVYTLEMTALKRLDGERPGDAIAALLAKTPEPAVDEISTWQTILEGYTSISNTMSNVINYVEELQSGLSTIRTAVSAFRQGISDFIAAPFGLVTDAIATVDTIIDNIVSLTDLPHEFTDLMRRTKRDLLALNLQPSLFKESTATASTTEVTTDTEIMTAPLPSGTIAAAENVVAMDTPEDNLFDSSLEVASDVSAAEEPVLGNDTLETIAVRTLGDGRQWQRIAMLNDLEYPYVVGDDPAKALTDSLGEGTLEVAVDAGKRRLIILGTVPTAGEVLLLQQDSLWEYVVVEEVSDYDGTVLLEGPLENSYLEGANVSRHERELVVLRPGDKVKIPGTGGGSSSILFSEEDFAAQIYGTDEYLDSDGFEDDDRAGDTATVSGMDNLEMQLTHRLMTLRGELAALGHPDYGCILPLLIGEIGTDYIYERAKLEAKLALLQDPRVQSVNDMTFTVNGTAIYLESDVLPINQSSPKRMSLLLVS